jgi:hypothetical protein
MGKTPYGFLSSEGLKIRNEARRAAVKPSEFREFMAETGSGLRQVKRLT